MFIFIELKDKSGRCNHEENTYRALPAGHRRHWAAPQLIAHRGGTGDAPENTLPAIKLALENNAEAIWVTVQLSRDGVPVLYRSSDLSALTNSEGKVSGLTAAELAKVDAGWKWGMTATRGAVSRPPFRPCKAFYSNGRTLFLYRYQISGCRSDRDGPAPA